MPAKHACQFLFLCLLFTHQWLACKPSQNMQCCIRGSRICRCSRISVTPRLLGCPMRIHYWDLVSQRTKPVQLVDKTLTPGLYTVVAFDINRLAGAAGIDLTWIIFLAINVEHSCFQQENPCEVQPAVQSYFAPCKDLFDHQSILNVFMIRQRQNVTPEYFIASGDILKREGLDASPFIVEFAKFRNTKLYDRTPVRGMRYIVVRCNRDGALTSVKRRLDAEKGFLEMEKYLYSYSPAYPVYEQIQDLFPELKPTRDMVKTGVNECSFRREFQAIMVERHLEPMFREPSCPDLDVQAISEWDDTEEGRASFRKHLNKRITDWVWLLNREKRHYDWVLSAAKKESLSFLKRAKDSKLGSSLLGNSSGLLSAKLDPEERTKYSPLDGIRKTVNQTNNVSDRDAAGDHKQVDGDSDNDGKAGDNKGDESNRDNSRLHQLKTIPEFSRSIIRIIYRGTRAMVRLQLLCEMYIHVFNAAPDYFAE